MNENLRQAVKFVLNQYNNLQIRQEEEQHELFMLATRYINSVAGTQSRREIYCVFEYMRDAKISGIDKQLAFFDTVFSGIQERRNG